LRCYIVWFIDFISEFWKILEFLFKKNRDTLKTKHFQNSIVYYLLFYFLVFLTSSFSILPIYGFQKYCKIFVLFYCMDPRFSQKILPNCGFFFQNKLRYLKSKIWTKFHRLLFLFNFFSIFGILFSISRTQTCPKIENFLWCFIGTVRDFQMISGKF